MDFRAPVMGLVTRIMDLRAPVPMDPQARVMDLRAPVTAVIDLRAPGFVIMELRASSYSSVIS